MKTSTAILSALLTESRVRVGLSLAVLGCLVAVLVLAWCFKLLRRAAKLPAILFAGVLPLFLLAVTWPQIRLPIVASLAALLLSCFSKRCRGALRLLLLLFTGLIPLFLLIGVDDPAWSAGFLLVYLGLINLEPQFADGAHAGGWYFVYCASLGFLWILLFAALLWYMPEPLTGA